MSPTILRIAGFRFYFHSREEARPHVHVQHAEGEAKGWREPEAVLAGAWGMNPRDVAVAVRLAKEHRHVLLTAWHDRSAG